MNTQIMNAFLWQSSRHMWTKLCTTDYSTVCSSGYFSIVLDQAARTGYIVLKFSSIVAKGDGQKVEGSERARCIKQDLRHSEKQNPDHGVVCECSFSVLSLVNWNQSYRLHMEEKKSVCTSRVDLLPILLITICPRRAQDGCSFGLAFKRIGACDDRLAGTVSACADRFTKESIREGDCRPPPSAPSIYQ